jgi:acyl-coenzyme A synthetase/AMP-(fatty) acid ligase
MATAVAADGVCLLAAFESIAAARPHALALEEDGRQMTYGALQDAARELAGRLLAQGVLPGVTTALLLPPGIDAAVAMLALLRCRSAIAVVEPDAPIERMRRMLELAEARVVVTTGNRAAMLRGALRDALPAGAVVAVMDAEVFAGGAPWDQRPDDSPLALETAFLRFTSGSTGEPKCAPRPVGTEWQMCQDAVHRMHFAPTDRHLGVTRFGATVFSRQLLPVLHSGGSMHLYTAAEVDPRALQQFMEARRITVAELPTTVARVLLRALPGDGALRSLRRLGSGGQAIHREDIARFQAVAAPDAVLSCVYAMTETGPLCGLVYGKHSALPEGPVPAGYVLPGRELAVVDEQGADVPAGTVGEIVVRRLLPASIDPENTVVQRIANASDGRVQFHTRDLGRFRDDGLLELVGRADDMVKVRNNRIALAEAERYLLALDGVQAGAMRALATPLGDHQLVGYVTLAPGRQATSAELKAMLRTLAPAAMVPLRIVVLDELPLTATGKVDRQRLPDPGTARPALGVPFAPPATERELQIAAVWEEILEVSPVGRHDPFGSLGGDSLSFMYCQIALEERYGIVVAAKYLLQVTPAQLAGLRSDPVPPPRGQWTRFRTWAKRVIQSAKPAAHHWLDPLRVCLPYDVGVHLVAWYCTVTLARWRWSAHVARLVEWGRRVHRSEAEVRSDVVTSLRALTGMRWRLLALLRPSATRWITIRGEEAVRAVLATGRPIVLAQHHVTVHSLGLLAMRRLTDRPVEHRLVGPTAGSLLLEAVTQLRRGTIVVVNGDGRAGTRQLRVPFWGDTLLFRTGFAELAEETGAQVVHLFTTMQPSGQVDVEFVVTDDPSGGTRAERIEARVGLFAEQFAARWPTLMASMPPEKLQHFLDHNV